MYRKIDIKLCSLITSTLETKYKMEQFKQYEFVKGKSDSLYIYILFRCPQVEILDHIKRRLDILERISDSYKRKLFSSRYYLFREYIENNNLENNIYNCVLFIDDSLNCHQLLEENIDILKKYDHQTITYKYDNFYDLDFIADLLFCDNPYYVYRINNNKIDYLKMTKTKKIVEKSEESKQLEIKQFIDDTLPPNKRYILHGVSAKIKNFSDERAYNILSKHIRDEEIIDILSKVDQEDLLTMLENDLITIQSKPTHKIVFKNNILDKIKNGQLEKLYINKKIFSRFEQNMKKLGLDINFKVIQIDTDIKSFTDNREQMLCQYSGVIGVTYY